MKVAEIFHSIQGEGKNSGIPMTFIRLQGCSVGCSFCDTKFSWDKNAGTEMSEEEILAQVKYDWVCLTGGEPAEQKCQHLIELLRGNEIKVQVETSGFGAGLDGAFIDHLVLSPKLSIYSYEDFKAKVSRYILRVFDELKLVVCQSKDFAVLEEFKEEFSVPKEKIWLQPVSCSKTVTEMCVEYCLENEVNISLQMHKFLEVR